MIDAILDALIDSLKALAIIFVFYFLISFIEDKLLKILNKKHSVVLSSSFGLIPSCGISVVASDLYLNSYLTKGALIAIFIACSDEALPIILTAENGYLYLLLLLVIKFITAIAFGYLIDFIFKSKLASEYKCEIHEHHNNSFVSNHLIHPLIHALKIGVYVLVLNLIFSIAIYLIGEDTLISFVKNNIYLTPLLSSLIGLIPNCASSILLSTLFVNKALTFSAMLAGLISNAGIGLLYLFKQKSKVKDALLILILLFSISLIVSYISLFIEISL